MDPIDFHDKPYDAGTIAKLQIFELYTQEWIPVFVSPPKPTFKEVHIFDFFCGPGTDSQGVPGSPLRIVRKLREYSDGRMAGWNKVRIVPHFFDENQEKVSSLKFILKSPEWEVPGIEPDCRRVVFRDAVAEHRELFIDTGRAKLLIIDQYGVNEVSDEIFRELISYPTTDFIFFLSSSILNRFRDHPAIKQKIRKPEDPYHVHREAVNYYKKLVPAGDQVYLGSFSIKKPPNIYGLIFGSHHPLGIHKFLRVAWATDEIAGEANFDIERENIRPDEGILPFEVMRPKKIQQFEQELEAALVSGKMRSEADLVRFCIEAGMTCKHSEQVLRNLKERGVIALEFRVPDIKNMRSPRPIRLVGGT